MKKYLIVLMILMAVVVPGIFAQELPDLIEIESPGLQPEGIEYDATTGYFLIGSLAEGTIYAVDDAGSLMPFIEDEELMSSVGIEIDENNHRLLVVNSDGSAFTDTTVTGSAMLGSYDLETGERVFMADLGSLVESEDARHFANDVTVDAEGNAYVTDSMSPVIYKVDLEGNAEIFLQDETFTHPFFGLNGIEYHPDGYLIASLAGVGKLYKIPLDDPTSFSQVEIDQAVAGDGMIWDGAGNLLVVSLGSVLQLTSDDDWASATVTAEAPDYPASTIVLREDAIYAVYPHFEDRTSEVYEIVRVVFEE